MTRFHACVVLLAAGVFGVSIVLSGTTSAEDFRVDNAVYDGDQTRPSSRSTTIFHGGVVYDCMKTPAETVVFDKTADRFILLNLTSRTRTELTTEQLATLVDRLQKLAVKSKDPVVRFLAEPKLQESSEETTGDLILTSPSVTYRLTLASEPNKSIVDRYHEFCDYYARLNALLSPGSRPPFGRLVVNAAVAQRQATPSQVVLTTTSGTGSKQQKTIVRSEHRVVFPLEPADLERVIKAREQMADFKLVRFDQYRKVVPR